MDEQTQAAQSTPWPPVAQTPAAPAVVPAPTSPEGPTSVPSVPSVPPLASLPLDLRAQSLYLNRELSWIEFNARVLAEADNEAVPLLAGREVRLPAQVVAGGGGVHDHLVTGAGERVRGLAGERLRPAGDLGAVALDDERDPHPPGPAG